MTLSFFLRYSVRSQLFANFRSSLATAWPSWCDLGFFYFHGPRTQYSVSLLPTPRQAPVLNCLCSGGISVRSSDSTTPAVIQYASQGQTDLRSDLVFDRSPTRYLAF
ncbi:hypothetical protein LINPERPRIM_LOCUS17825 [Linum perenne]